jgi:hypothetical protein
MNWNLQKALQNLGVTEMPFNPDGTDNGPAYSNGLLGYSNSHQVAVAPDTLGRNRTSVYWHELGHILLGHQAVNQAIKERFKEAKTDKSKRTGKLAASLIQNYLDNQTGEVEAEMVALDLAHRAGLSEPEIAFIEMELDFEKRNMGTMTNKQAAIALLGMMMFPEIRDVIGPREPNLEAVAKAADKIWEAGL